MSGLKVFEIALKNLSGIFKNGNVPYMIIGGLDKLRYQLYEVEWKYGEVISSIISQRIQGRPQDYLQNR
jgi:hypothetical protein